MNFLFKGLFGGGTVWLPLFRCKSYLLGGFFLFISLRIPKVTAIQSGMSGVSGKAQNAI